MLPKLVQVKAVPGVSASLTAAYFAVATSASAQVPVGQCVDNLGAVYGLLSDPPYYSYVAVQPLNFPGPLLQGQRDPTGIHAVRYHAPDGTPYFIRWDGVVVGISPFGPQFVGQCQGFIPPPPMVAVNYTSPDLAPWGVRTPAGVAPIPEVVARPGDRYIAPMIATPSQAENCMQETNGDYEEFGKCMAREMMSPDQQAAYECYEEYRHDELELGLCVAKINMGERERRVVEDMKECYDEHGTDWESYPTCYFSQSDDQNVAQAAQCLQQQIEEGDSSVWGFGVCYAGTALGLNPEAQIALECAMTTGGEPYSFVACTGGQLTARELDKCFSRGIGGDGCFGDNNDIIRGMRAVGIDIGHLTNPNGAVVRAFNTVVNDLEHGPGANNDAVRALNTAVDDLTQGPGPNNDVVQAIDQVLPGFEDLF